MQVDYLDDVHEYFNRITRKRLPSVTEIIGVVIGNGKFKFVNDEVMERARQRGKLVHAACHQLDEDELDWEAWEEFDAQRVSAGEEPILPRVRSYQMWRDETGFIPMENEKIVAHEELGYAGTLDKKGLLFAVPTIVDLKSGPVGDETAIQTAGYAIADGCVAVRRVGLRLIPNKIAKPTAFDDPMDIIAFKNFLGAYKWMVAHAD